MNSKTSGAGAHTYSITQEGARWLVWSKRANCFPMVLSSHRTESAAIKATKRAEAFDDLDRADAGLKDAVAKIRALSSAGEAKAVRRG